MPLLKRKPDYKWVILAVCFSMEFICLGFCSSNAGLYLSAVTKALDIERSLYSISTSIRYVVSTVVGLFFGTLIDRIGVKKMVCIGSIAKFVSTVLFSYADELYQFYLGGALLGLGVTLTGGTMAGTIIRRWFPDNVGRYTGIVMSANGIGGALAAQIISPLINEPGNPFGYRNAYKLSALIVLAASIVVVILLRERPEKTPAGTAAVQKKQRGTDWCGIDFRQARKKGYFYLSGLMVFLTGISLQSIGSISLAHMSDVGLNAEFVAVAATVSSLVLTVAKILVGTTYDKRGLGFALLMCQVATVAAFILYSLLNNSTTGAVLALIAVALSSLALPLETVMLPLMANDLFGKAGYSKALGFFMAMNSAGLCIGSPVGNLFYDVLGTYVPALWIFSGLMLAVAVGFRFVLRAADREKARILAENNSYLNKVD